MSDAQNVLVPALETERCVLRPMRPADAEAMYEIFSDPETMRYWNTPPHPNLEHTRHRLARGIGNVQAGETMWWGIERREDSRLLGNISLIFNATQREHRAEIGYILGREHWRQGYMGEAQGAVITYAFTELGLHRLEADADPRNAGSVGSLESLGFKREGTLRESWNVDGEISDSALYGLLASEWGEPA